MDMTGEFRIQAPRQRVWEGLYDPKILKECIPGCETIEKISDTEFAAKVVAKVGPVRAAFSGKVTLSDLDPPKAYTIAGEGSGGVAGFAKGAAKVRLDEDGDATLLHYEVAAHVGGKLAQIGSRLIDAVSRKMAADFFERFAVQMAPAEIIPLDATRVTALAPAPVEAGMAAPIPAAARAAEPSGPAAAEPEKPPARPVASFRLPPAVWVTALAIVVALMLYYFTRHGGSG
jgi:carbon monoxide dehydrogenase subunit G